ncbi:unnamed protein product [Allacma fusca]|uniref:Uncharacterized protein n=1 Tax=Allacma fusca TaxID=39272 RepID=A0A8J2PUX9_9HEXA|nr:unnamed protein product [Allacma fusca]
MNQPDMEDSLCYVQSIGGEVEIENMEPGNGTAENSLMTGEEDIYGDLDTLVFSSASKNKVKSREVLESRLTAAVKEISELKERITKLSTENLNLMNNFSSLLKTAREDKEKNIFTLRELRNQLRHVTNLNIQRSSLSREEVDKIHAYCNEVEGQLQSQISLQVIRQALDAAKREHLETNKSVYKRKWSKQFKFDNMSIYLCKEQVPFDRLERVTFPPQNLPASSQVSKVTDSQVLSELPEKKSKETEENSLRIAAPGDVTKDKNTGNVPEAHRKEKLSEDMILHNQNPEGSKTNLANGRRRNSREESDKSVSHKPYDDGNRKLSTASRQSCHRDLSQPRVSERLGNYRRKSRSKSKEPPIPSRSRSKRPRRTRSRSPSPDRRTRHTTNSYRRRR